jgi:hypothetical protein
MSAAPGTRPTPSAVAVLGAGRIGLPLLRRASLPGPDGTIVAVEPTLAGWSYVVSPPIGCELARRFAVPPTIASGWRTCSRAGHRSELARGPIVRSPKRPRRHALADAPRACARMANAWLGSSVGRASGS